jgi:hypothetical protein
MSLTHREITQRLRDLKDEHRELDEHIELLIDAGETDEMKVKRMKKRKLRIKDMIMIYEDMLIPDIDA